MKISEKDIKNFERQLLNEEKSAATIEKYLRDIRFFGKYLGDREITKENVMLYKERLKSDYAPASANSMLVALNCFLRFLRLSECSVRLLRIQRQIFCREDKELSRQEYRSLLRAANGRRISCIIQTICGTGIRVSELEYITVEAVKAGKASVDCKNKTRVILIPASIKEMLKKYIRKNGIVSGPVFLGRNGRPLDRSSIWRQMKALCKTAGVAAGKVFPHNLRHLFARTFYSIEKDIVRLADLLGHSSINTTRIYVMETGRRHLTCLEKMQHILLT